MLLSSCERTGLSARNTQAWRKYLRQLAVSRVQQSEQQHNNFSTGALRSPMNKPESRIPFENFRHALPQRDGTDPRATTVTRREGAAFRRLRELSESESHPLEVPSRPTAKTSNSAPLSALDALLDSLQVDPSAIPLARTEQKVIRSSPTMAKPLTSRESYLDSGTDQQPRMKESPTTARLRWRLNQNNAYRRVSWDIKSADTDMQIWEILQREVFEPITEFKLEQPTIQLANVPAAKTDQFFDLGTTQVDPLETIGTNFSHILQFAAETLRKSFPTSPLPVCLIAELRKLGPTYFALGVTTDLYNHALEHALIQDQDLSAGLDILDEMNREVIEPDERTLAILLEALDDARRVVKGEYGTGARIVRHTERHKTALREFRHLARTLQETFKASVLALEHTQSREIGPLQQVTAK